MPCGLSNWFRIERVSIRGKIMPKNLCNINAKDALRRVWQEFESVVETERFSQTDAFPLYRCDNNPLMIEN